MITVDEKKKKKKVVLKFPESSINRNITDKRTTAYKDTGKGVALQGWKPLRQYWIFRLPN